MAMQSPRIILASLAVAGTWGLVVSANAQTQDTVKIGFSVPMTGASAENCKQMIAAAKFFVEQNGSTVAGRKVELVIRDDSGVADQAKRIAQDLVVNAKVAVLAGYNPTPSALAVAPIATEAKVPQIVMGASTSIVTERSPYIVRTFSTQPQITVPMAQWAAKNGIKRVVTLVSDYAPGIDTEKAFIEEFRARGGEIIETVRMPMQGFDFAPYLQRARDAKPSAVFVFIPSGVAGLFLRQYAERGLQASGIKVIGTGDITDDSVLNQMGDSVLGIVTSLQYSAAHRSEKNRVFVEGFKRAGNGLRPNHVAVSVYDGLHLIYEALKKTDGDSGGDALIAAMKGMAWESPRGPIAIDPDTRDIIQDVYIRRVERVDGDLYNVEFEKFDAVNDPAKFAQTK
jgi:branched-chain amino acid transport system substrate-binding protein